MPRTEPCFAGVQTGPKYSATKHQHHLAMPSLQARPVCKHSLPDRGCTTRLGYQTSITKPGPLQGLDFQPCLQCVMLSSNSLHLYNAQQQKHVVSQPCLQRGVPSSNSLHLNNAQLQKHVQHRFDFLPHRAHSQQSTPLKYTQNQTCLHLQEDLHQMVWSCALAAQCPGEKCLPAGNTGCASICDGWN